MTRITWRHYQSLETDGLVLSVLIVRNARDPDEMALKAAFEGGVAVHRH